MRVKICGLTDPAGVEAALAAGAAYLGFVFFPKSPRNVTLAQAAALAAPAAGRAVRVALTVNADDALIDALAAAPIDMIQLHGAETPDRAAEIRARTGLKVMKAVGVAAAGDLDRAAAFAPHVDRILVDAKPAPGALPGGNGLAFDWRLLVGRAWPCPWMLAGGLTPGNVAAAIRLTGATDVDVSSGVETAPGVKSPELIRAFLGAALDARSEARHPS